MSEASYTYFVAPAVVEALENVIDSSGRRHEVRVLQKWEHGKRSSILILRMRGEPEAMAGCKADIDRFLSAVPLEAAKAEPSRAVRAAVSFAVGLAGVLGFFLLVRACY